MTQPAATPKPKPDPERTASGLFHAIGTLTRLIMIVPVIATFITATALLVFGAVETWRFVLELYFSDHPLSLGQALLMAIEIVDLFLLGMVVQVVSLGIYQLYFRQDLQLPKWLVIDSLDDLKSKLIGVIVTVLGVSFLGQIVVWTGDTSIVYLGAGVALVIAALTYFLSKIDHD